MIRKLSAPVADAAERREAGAVRRLLRAGHDANACQDNGMTALHWASYHGDVETAKQVIDAGADVNAQDHLGNTPLHYACGAEPGDRKL